MRAAVGRHVALLVGLVSAQSAQRPHPKALASPPPPPDLLCRDTALQRHRCTHRSLNCSDSWAEEHCARTCGLCIPVVVPVQVATLRRGRLPVPEGASPLIIEIGSSDRNTVDKELLDSPGMEKSFLISVEPLVEKYARALGRRERPDKVADRVEPLGQHHGRGIILPIAISDGPRRSRHVWKEEEQDGKEEAARDGAEAPQGTAPAPTGGAAPAAGHAPKRAMPTPAALAGTPADLKVMGASGCSSLLDPDAERTGMKFGAWCNDVIETRRVWTMPLEQLLSWAGQPVDMIKIDAQGMDLRVVRSGGAMLSRVKRFQLEVISDDCTPLYKGQPRCTHVVSSMREMGFVPVSHTPCSPIYPRMRANHYCELEILFVQATRDAAEVAKDAPFLNYHSIAHNGCAGVYSARECEADPEEKKDPPPWARPAPTDDLAVAKAGNAMMPGVGVRWGPAFAIKGQSGLLPDSAGRTYMCPRMCFTIGKATHPRLGELAPMNFTDEQEVIKRAAARARGCGYCPW